MLSTYGWCGAEFIFGILAGSGSGLTWLALPVRLRRLFLLRGLLRRGAGRGTFDIRLRRKILLTERAKLIVNPRSPRPIPSGAFYKPDRRVLKEWRGSIDCFRLFG